MMIIITLLLILSRDNQFHYNNKIKKCFHSLQLWLDPFLHSSCAKHSKFQMISYVQLHPRPCESQESQGKIACCIAADQLAVWQLFYLFIYTLAISLYSGSIGVCNTTEKYTYIASQTAVRSYTESECCNWFCWTTCDTYDLCIAIDMATSTAFLFLFARLISATWPCVVPATVPIIERQ